MSGGPREDWTVPFTVYDTRDGAILASGECPVSMVQHQVRSVDDPAHAAVLEERGDGATQKVDLSGGTPVLVSRTPDPYPFALLRGQGLERIKEVAAAVRRRYITDLPGQEMVYLRKAQTGRAYLADAAPDIADYPAIAAEIGITGATAHEVAQVWANLEVIWEAASHTLESARLTAVAAIEAAATLQDIADAEAAFRAALADL